MSLQGFRIEGFVTFRSQIFMAEYMGGSRGGQGIRTPPEKSQNIGFPSNTGPDPGPEKSQGYQAIIQCWAIIGTPAKRHLNGVSLAGRCWPTYGDVWIIFLLINLKKRFQSWTPLTKLSGSAHRVRVYEG